MEIRVQIHPRNKNHHETLNTLSHVYDYPKIHPYKQLIFLRIKFLLLRIRAYYLFKNFPRIYNIYYLIYEPYLINILYREIYYLHIHLRISPHF